jgi:SNF2 family DNA or RNA helicase
MSLDNIEDNKVCYVERSEISPNNDTMLYLMDKKRIKSIISNKSLYKTFEGDIKGKYSYDPSNFREKINESFILKNDEALKFLQSASWGCHFTIIQKQTLIPIDSIDYYVINYVNKTSVEAVYIHFIIAIIIDIKKIPDSFREIFSQQTPKTTTENCNFIKYLKCQMKFDFETINNLFNTSDENMEISNKISKCNANYMNQKMIEQPNFLTHNLYYYQKADIYFMMQREKEASVRKIILDEKRVVNWGTKYQCIFDKNEHGDTCEFIERRTVHNYKGTLNSFYGGCLCNSPGLGKTLEILTLCAMENSLNLVIVPEHLYDHWNVEYEKHIKKKKRDRIVLIQYKTDSIDLTKYKDKSVIVLATYKTLDVCKKLRNTNFTRLIIDEFHELFDKKDKTYPLIDTVKATYKWAITGTPFVNSEMIMNILNFIAEHKITSKVIAKYKCLIDVFCDMFRKNTKESVEAELVLPKINQKTYVLTLSDMERTMLNSICTSAIDKETSINRQMAFCINPNLYFQDENGISEKYISVNICEAKVINMHQGDYERLFKELIHEKLKITTLSPDNIMTNEDVIIMYDYIVKDIFSSDNIKKVLSHYHKDGTIKINDKIHIINEFNDETLKKVWSKFINDKTKYKFFGMKNSDSFSKVNKMEKDLLTIRSNMIYFEQQMKLINKKTKVIKEKNDENVDYVEVEENKDDDEICCSICLGEIDDDFTLLQCGHPYCTACLKLMLSHAPDKCPQCKFSLKNTIFYTPRVKQIKNVAFTELIKKYGTKIAHLINICKTEISNDKTIVYCDSPSLIDNLVVILNENNITAISPTPTISIIDTVSSFKKSYQVLVLSSEFNASGLNIQFAKSIVLLQPIRGEYARVRQTENQIIGRLHRIGQKHEINLIRLIIKDSIESEILRQNKIIDLEYTNANKTTDFPKSKSDIVKELDE